MGSKAKTTRTTPVVRWKGKPWYKVGSKLLLTRTEFGRALSRAQKYGQDQRKGRRRK